jgi:predicted PurR-regulated permease PerM
LGRMSDTEQPLLSTPEVKRVRLPSAMNFPPPTERQARILWAALTGLAIGVLLALVSIIMLGIGWIAQQLAPVLLPLAIAGIVAYLLDPVVGFLEQRGLPRARAIICVFALAAVIVAGLIGSVVPTVVIETRQLVERIPSYTKRMHERIDRWVTNPPLPLQHLLNLPVPQGTNAAPPGELSGPTAPSVEPPLPPEPSPLWLAFDPGALQSITEWLGRVLPKAGSWLFGQVTRVASWFGLLVGLALVPVYAFYFLLEKKGIQENWTEYLPLTRSGFKDELVFVLGSINDCLIAFFRGQVLVAICDGALYTIGFLVIGLPYAFLLGAMATVLTMVPFLGAIVTCATALIIAFVQSGGWLDPLLVLAVFAVVQTLEGFVIAPKIMGDRVGMHPMTIIVAVMAGTTLMGGIIGGVLAIPLAAVLRVLMFRYIWRKRD